MSAIPPVSAALAQIGIPHEVFVHPGPIQSLKQAAAERNQRPSQVARSVLFRLSEAAPCDGSDGWPRAG